tara:strand:+ start:1042 stop:2127 length:1086 start_codon:yes stop_codon:yes gene_type:complete
MNICLIGNGLTNLVLANILIKKKIKIDLYSTKKKLNITKNRTLGISQENIKFLKENGINLNNVIWPIKKIKIFNEKNINNEILNFNNKNEDGFSIVKNHELYKILKKKLKKNIFFSEKTIKNNSFYNSVINNYDLIINSDLHNIISKKYFSKKIVKDYKSKSYITTITHKKCKNNIAIQIFTKFGPLAFLPINQNKTSIVFSVFKKNDLNDSKILNLIKKYNLNYKINKFALFNSYELKLSLLKKYYKKNILAFGDCLHKIHPFAGQGFNMSLRDINIFSKIVDERLKLGLALDSTIAETFEKEAKHFNFLFSNGIDFIHEFFKFDNKIKNNYSKKIFDFINKNKLLIKNIKNFANKGFIL